MAKHYLILRAMLASLLLFCCCAARAEELPPEKWVVYYGDALPAEDFLPYDLIVFDNESHPPLRPLRNRKKTLLGYLSLGEAEDYRPDFKKIRSLGVLLDENKNWPGHYAIDIRNPQWAKYVIEEKIPAILFQRFDGIMLDTLDTPLHLAQGNQQYAGMKEAALNLLRAIRMHYPSIKIMLNRGFDAFPEAAESVDMVIAESILADYGDPEAPRFFEESVYESIAQMLESSRKVSPALKIYTLDYWNPGDSEGVLNIYARQREKGFIPYVATPDLQKLVTADAPTPVQ